MACSYYNRMCSFRNMCDVPKILVGVQGLNFYQGVCLMNDFKLRFSHRPLLIFVVNLLKELKKLE